MGPTKLAGLIVNRLNRAFAPDIVISACPAVDSVGRFRKINAPAPSRINNKQAGLWIEARCAVIRHSAFVWGNQSAIRVWLLVGVRNRPPLLIDAQRPIRRPKRNGQQIFSVGAVQNEKVAIA